MIHSHEESDIQIRVVNWLRVNHPGVIFTNSPAGVKMSIGQAMKMKRMGYLSGTPDLMIFEPRGKFHGLFIEIKRQEGTIQNNQKELIAALNIRGYAASVERGFDNVTKAIETYLQQPIIKPCAC